VIRLSDYVSKTWFAVLNNPADHGYPGTPEEVCKQLMEEWVGDSKTRSGWWGYCVSAKGLPHIHMVLEDTKAMRFTAIKKSYAVGMHMEPTKGRRDQVESYVLKKPPYDEKGETVLFSISHGEINGAQGSRSDLAVIDDLIDNGFKPSEIFAMDMAYRRYDKLIISAYMDKMASETPVIRTVRVHYIVGASGSGKSYFYKVLADQHGERSIYHVADYHTGYLDNYECEPILFLDEFKGEMSYGNLLTLLDVYKARFHCRYANRYGLWSDVYIASIFSPEDLYAAMVPVDRQNKDPYAQLLRRLTDITYCYKMGNSFKRFTIPGSEYESYAELQYRAMERDDCDVDYVPPKFNDLP